MPRRRLNPHRRPRDTSLWPTGRELREARAKAGFSVPELASRLKWSRPSLYEYEAAPRVDPEYAASIFAALGVAREHSPISLELVESGGCDPCQDGDSVTPAELHRWWDYRVTVAGRTFPSLIGQSEELSELTDHVRQELTLAFAGKMAALV